MFGHNGSRLSAYWFAHRSHLPTSPLGSIGPDHFSKTATNAARYVRIRRPCRKRRHTLGIERVVPSVGGEDVAGENLQDPSVGEALEREVKRLVLPVPNLLCRAGDHGFGDDPGRPAQAGLVGDRAFARLGTRKIRALALFVNRQPTGFEVPVEMLVQQPDEELFSRAPPLAFRSAFGFADAAGTPPSRQVPGCAATRGWRLFCGP